MSLSYIQAVPKQSTHVYKVLSANGDLSAKQIAEKANILPNAVYRAMKPLIELGMVEELATYPVTYRASSISDARDWYLRAALQSFRKDFGVASSISPKNQPTITFVKDRDMMRIVTEQEAQKAKKEINCILSGHRVADSTISVYRKAVTRGVTFQAIIENDPASPDVDLQAFEIMGANVKFLPNIGMRLFIFDKKTAVITSYDPEVPKQAFGIKFTYSPVAKQLDQLFEQRWQQAKSISKN